MICSGESDELLDTAEGQAYGGSAEEIESRSEHPDSSLLGLLELLLVAVFESEDPSEQRDEQGVHFDFSIMSTRLGPLYTVPQQVVSLKIKHKIILTVDGIFDLYRKRNS